MAMSDEEFEKELVKYAVYLYNKNKKIGFLLALGKKVLKRNKLLLPEEFINEKQFKNLLNECSK